jgi:hypothetical protein
MDRSDIELGNTPLEVRRRGRAGVVLSVRISADEAEQLQRRADERGVSVSEIAREAVTHYLSGGSSGGGATISPWTGETVGGGPVRLTPFGSSRRPGVIDTRGSVRDAERGPAGR